MAYILAVNPDILQNAGMPQPALITATALERRHRHGDHGSDDELPARHGPRHGHQRLLRLQHLYRPRHPWQSALGLVFINGCIFLLLSVTGVREKILAAIPLSLKIATSAGVGLFIAFIGLQNGGLIVANSATMVGMGDLTKPEVALFGLGVLFTCVLVARKVPGGIMLSMAVIALIGLFLKDERRQEITQLPASAFSWPASLSRCSSS